MTIPDPRQGLRVRVLPLQADCRDGYLSGAVGTISGPPELSGWGELVPVDFDRWRPPQGQRYMLPVAALEAV